MRLLRVTVAIRERRTRSEYISSARRPIVLKLGCRTHEEQSHGSDKKRGGPSASESQTVGGLAKRRRLFPTLRDDEANLLSQDRGSRRTRIKKQSQTVIKVEPDDDADDFIGVAQPAAKPKARHSLPNVYGSNGYTNHVVSGTGSVKARSTTRPEPRRTIPQDDD